MKLSNTTKLFNLITFYILLIVSIGMVGTFLSDYLIEINWFNDTKEIRKYSYGDEEYISYGARHVWYNTGAILLFIATLIRSIVSCFNYYNKLEKESKR